ncbi:MAG: hypothetical protein U0Q11_10545 [Vicinamibacterales bacterium]
MVCGLVIGRAGSVGFPGKNTFPVLGRPLASYPLMAARDAALVDRTYMSTDDPGLAKLARAYGAEVIERPAHLAESRALGEDVFKHGFEVIRDALSLEGQTVELMVLLFANAPTITAATIDTGIEILRKQPEVDSAITVSRYNMWSPARARRVDVDGLLKPFVDAAAVAATCDRDSSGDVWFADQGVSVVRPSCLEHLESGLPPQRWMGQRIVPLDQWGGLDIDYEWQVPLAEFWLRAHGFEDYSPK